MLGPISLTFANLAILTSLPFGGRARATRAFARRRFGSVIRGVSIRSNFSRSGNRLMGSTLHFTGGATFSVVIG